MKVNFVISRVTISLTVMQLHSIVTSAEQCKDQHESQVLVRVHTILLPAMKRQTSVQLAHQVYQLILRVARNNMMTMKAIPIVQTSAVWYQ